jgi:hypothetical protein
MLVLTARHHAQFIPQTVVHRQVATASVRRVSIELLEQPGRGNVMAVCSASLLECASILGRRRD